MTIYNPTSWWAYLMSVFFQGTGMIIVIIFQGYVAKRMPKMIRGITNAVMGMLGVAGSIPYLALSDYFTKLWGPIAIWGTMAALDALMLLFVMIMIIMGKYGTKPNINDGESDRGADEGQGGYSDIPDLGPDGGNIVKMKTLTVN